MLRKEDFCDHADVRLRFKLALGLGAACTRDGVLEGTDGTHSQCHANSRKSVCADPRCTSLVAASQKSLCGISLRWSAGLPCTLWRWSGSEGILWGVDCLCPSLPYTLADHESWFEWAFLLYKSYHPKFCGLSQIMCVCFFLACSC